MIYVSSVTTDEIYPREPRPLMVEVRDKLLTYLEEPRPLTVEVIDRLLT